MSDHRTLVSQGLITPTVHSPIAQFVSRTTRSGAIFSQWVTNLGPPIHAPPDFDLTAHINAAHAEDADTSLDLPDEDDAPLAAFQSDATMSTGNPQPPEETVIIPPLPVFDDPPVTIEAASKHQFHAREHSKKRRRAAAAVKLQQSSSPKRQLKAAAKRHRDAAVPLHTSADTLSALESTADTEDVLLIDDAAAAAGAASASEPIVTDYSLEMEDVPVASTAFQGQRYKQTAADQEPTSLEQLQEMGIDIVKWSGLDARPVVDKDDTAFVVLGGQPFEKEPGSNEVPWSEVQRRMCLIFEYLRKNLRFNKSQVEHRRGNFPAVSVGISFGGGQQRVGNLAHSPHNAAVLEAAMQSTPMRRVANFASTSMELFAPKLHKLYGETLDALCDKDPSLKRNFKNNVFACATCNLGPKSVAHVHRDHLNFAPGWCAITAFGDYDPTQGGHLILWDLKMAIEFPPGSTIIIPSAILRHSNVPLAGKDETRYALIQYSAGGLFRWVECGHQTQKDFKASGGTFKQTAKERWERGIALFSKWSELLALRKSD